MLKTTSTSNPYCVPSALALLLDTDVDTACNLIREELGEQAIAGIFYPVILKKLHEAGFRWKELSPSAVKLLHKNKAGRFLLCFKGHVGVMLDGTYYDNQHPAGISRPTQAVRSAYEVTR